MVIIQNRLDARAVAWDYVLDVLGAVQAVAMEVVWVAAKADVMAVVQVAAQNVNRHATVSAWVALMQFQKVVERVQIAALILVGEELNINA